MKKFLVGTLIVLLALAALFAGTAYAEESESASQENATSVAEIIGGDQYPSVEAAFDAVSSGQTIRLLKDSTPANNKQITLPENKVVIFDLNSHTFTSRETKRLFEVPDNTTFTLTDNSVAKTGALIGSGTVDGSGGGVLVNGGTFIMEEGTIKNCTSKTEGGGVSVTNKGSFTMSNGTITECSSSTSGGGVGVGGSSKFTMTGGNITKCTGRGAGVSVYTGGQFEMKGGNITDCNAGNTNDTNHGGGVAVYDDNSMFKMSGTALIKNCTAVLGGGVLVGNFSPTFVMDGGEILSCTSQNGGGVHVGYSYWGNTGGKATINDGKISECRAQKISECSVETGAGGVNVAEAELIFNGGTIENCTGVQAGGVTVWKAKLTMNGGDIKNCTGTDHGGLWIADTSTATITGGNITGCKSTDNGGGANIDDKSTLKISGSPKITNNFFTNTLTETNVWLCDNTRLQLTGDLTDDAKIGITLNGETTIENKQFGTATGNHAGADKFIDDRNLGIRGEVVEDGSGSYILKGTYLGLSVTYDGNGSTSGTAPVDTTKYSTGATVTVLSHGDLGKTGHHFDCWNNGTQNYAEGETFTISKDETLKAKWSPNVTTLTLDPNGGSGASPSKVNVTYNSKTIDPEITNPTYTGHTFHGWNIITNPDIQIIGTDGKLVPCAGGNTDYTDENGNWVNVSIPHQGTLALTAIWTANQTTITIDLQNGTGGTTQVTAEYDQTMPMITAPTREGYTFCGIYENNDGTGTQYYQNDGTSTVKWDKDTSTATLYAVWKPVITGTDKTTTYTTSAIDLTTLSMFTYPAELTPKYTVISGDASIDGTNLTVKKIGDITLKCSIDKDTTGYKHIANNTTASLTVNAIPITITALEQTIVYGKSISSDPANVTVETLQTGDKLHTILLSTTKKTAGEHENDITPSNAVIYNKNDDNITENYTITYVNGNLTITKAPLTVTAKDTTITYGDAPKNNGVDYSGFITGEGPENLGGTLAYDYDYQQFGNIGTYTITPKGQTSDNYNITYTNGKLTVNKRMMTGNITITLGPDPVYDGNQHTIEITSITDTNLGGRTVDQSDYDVSGNTGTAKGTYELKVTGKNNYASDTITKNWNIIAKQVTITWPQTSEFVYNAQTQYYNATIGNISESDKGHVTFTYSNDTTLYATNAGDYTAKITGLEGTAAGNYSLPAGADTQKNWSITKKPVTYTNITANNKVYDKTTAAVINLAGAEFNGKEPGDTLTLTGLTGTFDTAAAGTDKTVTFSGTAKLEGTSASNYTIAESGNQTKTTADITKAPLTVTAKDTTITYGDAPKNNGVTYSGFITGDDEKTSITGTPAYTYTYKKYDGVGDYKITPDTGTLASDNYKFKFASGKLSVNAKPMENNVTLILKTNLTYNGTEQTMTIQSLKFNDGTDVNINDYTVSGDKAKDAKDYTFTVTGRYNLTSSVSTQWAITKKPVTYANITANNKVYDKTTAAVINLAGAEFNGKEAGDTLTLTGLTGTFDTAAAGTDKTVTFSGTAKLEGTSASNYTIADSGNQTKTTADITKVELGVKANDTAITYGEVPKNNGVTYSGFIAGEGPEDLGGTLTYDYDYQQFGNIGTYTITPKGQTSDNYNITYTNGKLTVNKRMMTGNVTITLGPDPIYDGNPHTIEITSITDTNLGGRTVDPGDYDVSGNTGTAKGTYKLNVTGKNNYASDTITKNWNIIAKPVTITWPATSEFVYNAQTQYYNATIGNISESDKGHVTFTYSNDTTLYATNAGDYAAKITGLEGTAAGNYSLPAGADTPKKWSITKKPVTYTNITANNKVYDKTTAAVINLAGAEFNGKEPGDTLTLTGLTGTFDTATAGTDKTVTFSGTAVLGGASVNNYTIAESGNQTKTTADITKVELGVKANDTAITYGEVPKNNGVTYSGFITGEGPENLGGTLAYDYDYQQFGNIGTYTITPKGQTSDNYNITYTNGKLTVNKRMMTGNVTITLGPDPIYDGNPHTIEITSITDTNLGGHTVDPSDYDVSGNTGTAKGTYKLNVTGKNNYASDTITKNWNIIARPVTITWPATSEFEYNAQKKHYDATIGNLSEGDSVTFTYSNDTTRETVNAGTYNVKITGLQGPDAAKYTIPDDAVTQETWTVTKRPAVITVDNASKKQGETDPVFTGNVAGLINQTDLGTITYLRTPGEAVGTYTIYAKYTENANYSVAMNNGTFTISAQQTPKPGSGGSSDTGSGHYTQYLRQVSNTDTINFGTSQIVTSVNLNNPTTGTISVYYDTDASYATATYAADVAVEGENEGKYRTAGIKGAPILITNPDGNQTFYRTFRIESELKDGKVTQINFKVPKSGIAANAMTKYDVILYHGLVDEKNNGEWIPLDTYLTGEDKTYAYYKAYTDGTSPFAIVFMEDMTIIDEAVQEPVPVPADETEYVPTAEPTAVQTTEPGATATESPKSPLGIAGMLAGLGATLGCIYGIRRRE